MLELRPNERVNIFQANCGVPSLCKREQRERNGNTKRAWHLQEITTILLWQCRYEYCFYFCLGEKKKIQNKGGSFKK